MVKEVSSLDEYNKLKSGDAVLFVDYFATWCGPCRWMAGKIEDFEKDYPGIVFIKVDVGKSVEIAERAGLNAMPTYKLFKYGKEIDEINGASPSAVKEALDKVYA